MIKQQANDGSEDQADAHLPQASDSIPSAFGDTVRRQALRKIVIDAYLGTLIELDYRNNAVIR
ncbi:MAG: hypothetical protein ACM3PP_08670 [Candidatus Saccharibacteria bacterium]